jgi:hypothetical protein
VPKFEVTNLPKRSRSGAFQFTKNEVEQVIALLEDNDYGTAITVTDPVKVSDHKAKKVTNRKTGEVNDLSAADVARNVINGRNNTIREALDPHIRDGEHVRMHVVTTDNGKSYVGAVTLREGARKPRGKKATESAE